jgi:hypothetical protein
MVVSVVLPAGGWATGRLLTLGILAVAMPVWRVAFDGITSDPHLKSACSSSAAARPR